MSGGSVSWSGEVGQLDAARHLASRAWDLQFCQGEVTFDGTALKAITASQLWLWVCMDYQVKPWEVLPSSKGGALGSRGA